MDQPVMQPPRSSKNHSSQALTEEDRHLWEKVKRTVTATQSSAANIPKVSRLVRLSEKPGSAPPLANASNQSETSGQNFGEMMDGFRTSGKAAGIDHSRCTVRPAVVRDVLKNKPAQGDKLAGLDRKTRSRLSRGANRLGGSIDLHGMRQDEAHRALRRFLAAAQQRGDRFVIVITGKGTRSPDGFPGAHYSGQGILRSAVPRWFSTESFRDLVVGFSEAAQSHGGGGALYVQIRRHAKPLIGNRKS